MKYQYKLCNILASSIFIATIANNAYAATLSVPSQHATIQSAIAAAINGDVIQVSPGTYKEHINFLGKKITVVSTTPSKPELTIIDGSGTVGVSVVTFASGESPATVLEGFTIANGKATVNTQAGSKGGGIHIKGEVKVGDKYYPSNPTLKNLIIENNEALYGGGISCVNNTTITIGNNPITMENVTIRGNKATYGGGVFSLLCPFNYKNSEVFANSAKDGAGVYIEYGSGYYGGYNFFDNVKIENNIASENGGGLRLRSTYNPDHIKLALKDVTLQCNEAKLGAAIHCDPNPKGGGHPGYTLVDLGSNFTINALAGKPPQIHYDTGKCSFTNLVAAPIEKVDPNSFTTFKNDLKCNPEAGIDEYGYICLTGGKGTGKPFSWMVKDYSGNIVAQNLNDSMGVGQSSQSMAASLASRMVSLASEVSGECINFGANQFFVGEANTTPSCDTASSTGCVFNPLARRVSTQKMLSKIRGFVWNDLNASRLQESNEDYLPNWKVTLKRPDGTESTATTGTDGYYEFPDLMAGVYTVTIESKTQATYTTAQSFSREINLADVPRTANFGIKVEKASLIVTTTGSGLVSSSPVGIDCGSDCQEEYPFGTEVVLTATPTGKFVFLGWEGDCSGAGECKFMMNQERVVRAIFKDTASACKNPASYDAATGVVSIQKLDVALLSPLDGKPTGEIAVFEAQLKQAPGVADFQILPNTLKFLSMSDAFNPDHARFDWQEEIFSLGGKLQMCVSVPSVVVIQGMQIPTINKTYSVSMRTLAINQGVFHIDEVVEVTP